MLQLRRLLPGALAVLAWSLLLQPQAVWGQSLRGGRASLDDQNRQARAHDFTYLGSARQLASFVREGLLVRLGGNRDYVLKDVSFPYARPEVKLFVERMASQFRAACGTRLVVTSLTRPTSHQPGNASSRSVHPTGMAVDLRRHTEKGCRSWLERVLLSLERADLLEATLEHSPPHYHVALYPEPYRSYVERITGRPVRLDVPPPGQELLYHVNRRDTLWRIARDLGITAAEIQAFNGLRSSRIYPGQVLKIPPGADAQR